MASLPGPSPPAAGPCPSWLDSLYFFQQSRQWKEEEPAHEAGDGEAVSDTRSDDGGSVSTMRRTWTVQEDQLLGELIEKLGPRKWAQIAQHFQDRTSKQCHQR